MGPLGNHLRRLALGEEPAFSADGKHIAFVRESGGVWVMHANGSGQHELTPSNQDSYPAWSPDGRTIAFSVSEPRRQEGIWTMNSDGTGQRRLTHRGIEPAWSPDGSEIAFQLGWNVDVVPAAGGRPANLTNGVGRFNAYPAWSPDGTKILFVTNRDETASNGMSGLWVMNADGSDPHAVFEIAHTYVDRPAWSPDGRLIAFGARRDESWGEQLYIIRSDGTHQRPIVKRADVNDFPAWQPLPG